MYDIIPEFEPKAQQQVPRYYEISSFIFDLCHGCVVCENECDLHHAVIVRPPITFRQQRALSNS